MPHGSGSVHRVLALADALAMVAGQSFCRARIHLPASLCSTPVTALPRSYGGSDFHRFVQREAVALPDSLHLTFPAVLSPTTRCPSMAASSRSFSSRSGLFPDRAVSRLRPSGLWASPFVRRLARTSSRIEFLSYGPAGSPSVALHPTFGRPQLTIPFGDAVTFGFQPVERLVERVLTSSSDALSGARAPASSPAGPRASRSRRRRDAAGPAQWP
jgi:hypothetical protein